MKKILLLALLAASTGAAHAQSIAAGTISLGGNIGYSRSSTEFKVNAGRNSYTNEFTTSRFQFSPAVGYFIADNLAIGVNLGYTAERTTTSNNSPGQPDPDNPEARTNLRVGPYVQYYKMLSEQFGVLGTLGAGYQNSTTPSTNNSDETKANGFYAAITPGVIFFPIPKFGISASIGNLGYDRLKLDTDANSETSASSNTFGASFGLSQLQFGGTYFFGR
jgi:hypothetical protein